MLENINASVCLLFKLDFIIRSDRSSYNEVKKQNLELDFVIYAVDMTKNQPNTYPESFFFVFVFEVLYWISHFNFFSSINQKSTPLKKGVIEKSNQPLENISSSLCFIIIQKINFSFNADAAEPGWTTVNSENLTRKFQPA